MKASSDNPVNDNRKEDDFIRIYSSALFDDNGSLIDTNIDELPFEALYPHPLSDFYDKYSKELLTPEDNVFIPYEAAVPVVQYSDLQDYLSKRGLKVPEFRLLGARRIYKLDPGNLVIGILTAGGNAPGLNTVIDSIVKRHSLMATINKEYTPGNMQLKELKIWGYYGGYPGLVSGEKKLVLDVEMTDKFSCEAGCILGMQRGDTPEEYARKNKITQEKAQQEITGKMADAVERDKLDILYVIGGNGTITAAEQLCRQIRERGITGRNNFPTRVIAAPKTMDNDVYFTDVTLGFRTTVEKAVSHIKDIHVDAETCGRIAIIELFGAASGFVALHASYSSGEVDYVLIPEMFQGNHEKKQQQVDLAIKCTKKRYDKNGHAVLVIAEGASAAFDVKLGEHKHQQRAAMQSAFESLVGYIKEGIKKINSGKELPVFTNQPKHLVRCSPPNTADIDLCKQTGKLMADAALSGMSQCVVSYWGGNFVAVPMELAIQHRKKVNIGGYYFLTMMEKYLLNN